MPSGKKASPAEGWGNDGTPGTVGDKVGEWNLDLVLSKKPSDRARRAAEKLTATTEMLNAALRTAEKEIAALGLGVTAFMPMDETDPDDHDLLTFGKHSNEWKLLYEVQTGPDTYSVTPLLNANREIRMAAVALIPTLVERMILVAEKHAEEVAQKAEELSAFLNTLTLKKTFP
jgi:hypothetical protein